MRTVTNLLWPAEAKPTSNRSSGLSAVPSVTDWQANTVGLMPSGSSSEAGEVLRKLIADAGHQLDAIDGLKHSFGKLAEPLDNLLAALDRHTADSARSQAAFEAIRGSHDALTAEFKALEAKSSDLEHDNARLRRDLEAAQRSAKDAEDDRMKLANEISGTRLAMSVIAQQLGEESGNARTLREEKGRIAGRVDASDKRIAEFDIQVAQLRQRVTVMENEKAVLQAALDKALSDVTWSSWQTGEGEGAIADARHKFREADNRLAVAETRRKTAQAESARLTRHLAERENALSDFRKRVQELESRLAAAEAERGKVAAAGQQADERRHKDAHELRLELHELRARLGTAENLLAEAQQTSATRAEDLAAAEAKLLETSVAWNEAEQKLEHLGSAEIEWQQQTTRLECEVANLTDRCQLLAEQLGATQNSLGQANQQVKALTAQVEKLQAEAAQNRARTDKNFLQLKTAIESERRERAATEAALERSRGDYARLQRVMAEDRPLRRNEQQRRVI